MITSCTHCSAQYELPDKMLGRQARCKACKKLFVISPVESEVVLQDFKPPQRKTGSTAQMSAVQDHEEDDDPLAALAAASESGSGMAPAPRARQQQPHAPRPGQPPVQRPPHPGQGQPPQQGPPRPKKSAKGAGMALGLGIAGLALSFIATICLIVVVFVWNVTLFQILGSIGLLLLGVSAILGMMAAFNGTSATRHIRRSRHPLGGKGLATTGTLLGMATIAIVLLVALIGAILLFINGGIVFETVIIEGAAPVEGQ